MLEFRTCAVFLSLRIGNEIILTTKKNQLNIIGSIVQAKYLLNQSTFRRRENKRRSETLSKINLHFLDFDFGVVVVVAFSFPNYFQNVSV